MQIVSHIFADILHEIGSGQGRNSKVYLAHDPQLNGNIALKEIPIVNFRDTSEYFKEAQTLFANSCTRVVPVQYACCDSSYIRIVMPYFPNGSLQNKIENNPLPVRQVILWADQFLNGLHHVHANGFVHFDVKPSNILIHNDGGAVLADFGQTMPINNLGVADVPPMYLLHFPPEAFTFDKVTKQADMYQVGLTLYRMCNGDKYFKSQLSAHPDLRSSICLGKFPSRDKYLPHIPKRLKRIIKTLLKVDPGNRYQTIIDLQNDLGQVDKLLDWEYHTVNSDVIWKMRNFQTEYEIRITPDGLRRWIVEGHTIRRADGNRRRRNYWCGGSFSSKAQAETFVARIFREMEVGT